MHELVKHQDDRCPYVKQTEPLREAQLVSSDFGIGK